MKELVSNCCSSTSLTEIVDGQGMCRDCKEWCEFVEVEGYEQQKQKGAKS
jgi:hypothetical protein